MRPLLALVLATAAGAAGCGGGNAPEPPAPAPHASVSTQLRVALEEGMHPHASLTSMGPPPESLHAHVRACSGPPRGGAGSYRCTLRPDGHGFAPHYLIVDVKRDGSWSTTIPHNPREHRRSTRGMWGGGLNVSG